ncbi:MAG: N-acetylneuraminate synthase family protein [Candidatus Peribacteraceae bacterium]|nr:N-acetylneuraminate synthase family protein [Candidatus Peribacteraceae bacterium]
MAILKVPLRSNGAYVIAEAGVNHNGQLDLAKKLIDVAVRAGADAVKFQLFDPDELASDIAPLAAYQERSGEENQKAMLRRLTLPLDAYRELKEYAEAHGIDFITTPFDAASARFLAGLHVKAIKIPSSELTNTFFLQEVAGFGIPVILSTGQATLEEIHEAVQPFQKARLPFALLHCVSSYPSPIAQSNLKAMETLRREFSVPVGYSDHTEGIDVTVMAASLGAEILEKHFTLDRTMTGPDHAASIEPDELTEMIRRIRDPQTLRSTIVPSDILGDGEKKCQPCEVGVRAVSRRSVTAAQNIAAGTVLRREMLAIRRPGTGIAPRDVDTVIGKTLLRPLKAGEVILWDTVSH